MDIITINQSKKRMPRRYIEKWLTSCVAKVAHLTKRRPLSRELSVVFMDTPAAKKLNQQFRGRAYATDVLSFEGDGVLSLGELVLCPQVIEKQAKEHGLTFRLELGYMLLHGYLHLLGYDHEKNERQAREMFRIQDQIFDDLCR